MSTQTTCSECPKVLPAEPEGRPGPLRRTCSVRCRQARARRMREERLVRDAVRATRARMTGDER